MPIILDSRAKIIRGAVWIFNEQQDLQFDYKYHIQMSLENSEENGFGHDLEDLRSF